MFYRLEFRNIIQKWLSFANCKLPLMKWIEINLVTWMNQSLYSQHFGEFFFLAVHFGFSSHRQANIKLAMTWEFVQNHPTVATMLLSHVRSVQKGHCDRLKKKPNLPSTISSSHHWIFHSMIIEMDLSIWN